jgi:hypothetical protein
VVTSYFKDLQQVAKSIADNRFSGLPSHSGSATLVLKDRSYGLIVTASHTAEASDLTEKMKALALNYIAVPFNGLFVKYLNGNISIDQVTDPSTITNQYRFETPQMTRTDVTIDFAAKLIYKPAFEMSRKSNHGFYLDYENIPVELDFSLALVPLEALEKNHLSPVWEENKKNWASKNPDLYRGLIGVKPLRPQELAVSDFSSGLVFTVKDDQLMIGWGERDDSDAINVDISVKSGVSGSGLFNCRGQYIGIIVRSTEGTYIDSNSGKETAKTIAVSMRRLARTFHQDLKVRQIDEDVYLSKFPLIKRLVDRIDFK